MKDLAQVCSVIIKGDYVDYYLNTLNTKKKAYEELFLESGTYNELAATRELMKKVNERKKEVEQRNLFVFVSKEEMNEEIESLQDLLFNYSDNNISFEGEKIAEVKEAILLDDSILSSYSSVIVFGNRRDFFKNEEMKAFHSKALEKKTSCKLMFAEELRGN